MTNALEERGARGAERVSPFALRSSLVVLVLALFLSSCQQFTPGPTATPPPTLTSVPTITPLPPTATAVPLAARVNGQDIALSEYEAEVKRCELGYQQAGRDPALCPTAALQGLVESAVMEQAAESAGIVIDDAATDAAMAQAEADLGGAEAFTQYLGATGYSAETYREAMRRDLLRARMAVEVAAAVAPAAEQVHALLILVGTEAEARSLQGRLQGGADFASLALENSLDASSRVAGGDLGWFARGTLTTPEIETAAFALEPGGVSDVVATSLGYAIVRVEERDPARELSPDQLRDVRKGAVQAWLADLLAKAQIEMFVTP